MTTVEFEIKFSLDANVQLNELESNPALKKHCKAVYKALSYLEVNPRHPSLNTHKYSTILGPNGEDVFEAYAENNTPGAFRIFWVYGPGKSVITVIAITPHP